MKIDRLLGIVFILMSRRCVQAKELAEIFNVSVRTIYRDIIDIDQAGIPVTTYQGTGGGIGLAETYKLDKSVFTCNELAAIQAAVGSLAAFCNDHSLISVIEKLKVISASEEQAKVRSEQIFIDFSPWGGNNALREKFTLIRQAITGAKRVAFVYSNSEGETTQREVEPYTLVLKDQRWYLYAFCKLRNSFRFFKLSRIRDALMLNTEFERVNIRLYELPWEKDWHASENTVQLKLKFAARMRYFVEEYFDMENVRAESDGTSVVTVSYPDNEWAVGFVLSFGGNVIVLEPAEFRARVGEMALQIHQNYC